ncbi:MAG: hypothetical protein GSR85_09275 [Desulfurococcales archaeon]|nr:hypothetical protein [Desulfurococcales archaeon]
MTGLLLKILDILYNEGPLAPGDVAQKLGEPRYRVLASFHCLKELGLISEVYSKGSYKVFRVSIVGEAILKEASKGANLASLMEKAFMHYEGNEEIRASKSVELA